MTLVIVQVIQQVIIIQMYYLLNKVNQVKAYIMAETPPPIVNPSIDQPKSGSISLSFNSFQLIVSDILEEPPSSDFVLLEDTDPQPEFLKQQGLENMYLKDFLLIGKPCEGRALTFDEWNSAIKKGDLSQFSKKDIYFSLLKGIDYKIRKDVWQVLANSSQMKKQAKFSYKQLSNPLKLPHGELDMIDKDVKRTAAVTKCLPELRNILISYVNLSGKGYTQGMNLIVGVLLKLLSIQNDKQFEGHSIIEQEFEERVFWVLVGVMQWKKWSELFDSNLSGLQRMLQTLRELMAEHVPGILSLIEDAGWDLGIFAQYYVTICLYNCPADLAPLVLDLFLLDGELVIHSLLIRMMVLNKQTILKFKDECQLMKYLKTDMLNDAYRQLVANRKSAKCLQDFAINFFKTVF